MYKIEDDHLNWCLFSKVQVEELCRQTEKNPFLTLQKDEGTVSSTRVLKYDTFRSTYQVIK